MSPEIPLTLRTWNLAAEAYYDHLKKSRDHFQDQVNGPAILQLLPDDPNLKLVDMGCGPGRFTKIIAKQYPTWKIFGFDGVEILVRHAKKHKPSNIIFFKYDINDLSDTFPVESESCDLVIAKMVFPSLMDLTPAITRASRMLKDNGKFIISTLDDKYVQEYTYPKFENWFYFFTRNMQLEVVSELITRAEADRIIENFYNLIKSNPLAIWTPIAKSNFTIPIYSHPNDMVKGLMDRAGFQLITEQFCGVTREFASQNREYINRIGQKITWNTVWRKMSLGEKLSRSSEQVLYHYEDNKP